MISVRPCSAGGLSSIHIRSRRHHQNWLSRGDEGLKGKSMKILSGFQKSVFERPGEEGDANERISQDQDYFGFKFAKFLRNMNTLSTIVSKAKAKGHL